jgi:hypothetical protein
MKSTIENLKNVNAYQIIFVTEKNFKEGLSIGTIETCDDASRARNWSSLE